MYVMTYDLTQNTSRAFSQLFAFKCLQLMKGFCQRGHSVVYSVMMCRNTLSFTVNLLAMISILRINHSRNSRASINIDL
jgi:hypothetical protein